MLITLAILALTNLALSQTKEPEIVINFLANDNIAEVNVEQENYISSIGAITEYFKNNLKDFPSTQKFGVLIITHKTGEPTYKCYSNPKIDATLETKILSEIKEIKLENTKLVDFPVFISINCKNKKVSLDFEDFVDPSKQKLKDYENADFETKVRLNKEFAINEALPVLSAFLVIVDDKFVGVKSYGNLIQTTNFEAPQSCESLTSQNKNYWRAIMEMNIGNQVIPISKIFTLVSQGEFDHAKRYIEIIQLYSDPKSISNDYLKEMNYRLNLFEEELNTQIQKGITEHDKGNYDKAIEIYSSILSQYPNSSWTLYEKYYSENAKNIQDKKITPEDRKDWDIAKVEIYKHNPLYNIDVRASNGKEAYLFYRRQEINTLFKRKEDRLTDIYKYAEIAADLGQYDFAAQLFWICTTFDKENSKNALNHYLYCLDKLGETEVKSNFKGNFPKIFKKIDQERESAMKKNTLYKAMKEKE
ncbi:MAG: hypothetical protein ACK476_05575 [Fluviicola sp.]